MRMTNHSPIELRIRKLVLLLMLVAFGLFNTGSTLAAKTKNRVAETATANAKAGNSQRVGQLIVTGSVTVNDKKAITGTTIFTDSHIVVACAKGNSAIVNLGRLGRIELTAGAKLTLQFSEGLIGGDLAEGQAVISTPAGVRVAVNTADGVASAGGAEAAVTPVVAQRGVRCVPVVVTTSSQTTLSNSTLTAAILGVAGGAATIVAVASKEDEASPTRP
jgi:hypothetical protein